MALSRRRFLQVGLAGAAVLAAARLLERPTPSTGMVGALAAVVLAGALPVESGARAQALREVVEAFDRAVAGLSPAVREEIDSVLGLLRFAPSRMVLAGLPRPLEEASAGEIAGFFERWRDSRFDLLRAAYQALTQLIQASWYDNPRAWLAIGYPGPPALAAR